MSSESIEMPITSSFLCGDCQTSSVITRFFNTLYYFYFILNTCKKQCNYLKIKVMVTHDLYDATHNFGVRNATCQHETNLLFILVMH